MWLPLEPGLTTKVTLSKDSGNETMGGKRFSNESSGWRALGISKPGIDKERQGQQVWVLVSKEKTGKEVKGGEVTTHWGTLASRWGS